MISYYFKGWKRAFDFNGRATRKEFWWFVFWDIILILIIACLIEGTKILTLYSLSLEEKIPSAIALTKFLDYLGSENIFSATLGLIYISSIIPRISLAVRRLHDIGRSGFWFFLQLVPILNLILLIWYCSPSLTENESAIKSNLNQF